MYYYIDGLGLNMSYITDFYQSYLFNLLEDHHWMAALLTMILLIISATLIWRKCKNKELLPEVKELVGIGSTRPRFRKRDKVMFYGRKIMRKVRSISGQVHGAQGKKRKIVMKFARRLLQLKKETTPQQLKVLEPPVEYLQEDISSKDEQRVPPDAFYMLQSIRVFGHFEKPIFLKLCKHTDILNLPSGAYLFKIGDPDENVYVVQNGRVNVYITGADGEQISLKVVKTGDSVTSLLSFTDVLTGHPKPYKTVSARALEDSTVVRLPMAAFKEVFKEYPDTFIRVMQVIMVRLQRVTFTALHQHLGLSAELVNQGTQKKKTSPFTQSPVKSKPKELFPNKDDTYSGGGANGASQQGTPDAESQPIPILNQHRRSRSGMEIRFSNQQPDIMPEAELYSLSQATPDLQSGLGNHRKRSQQIMENYDEETLIKIATEAFVRELGLENDTLLQGGKIEIREVPGGTYLMKEDSHKDVALIYVLTGSLLVSQKTTDNQEEVHMFNAYPGEIVGGLAVLTAEPSFFTIRAKHSCRIALLSKNSVYGILCEKPEVVLHIAHTVVSRLSPFVRQVDFALDWVFLEAGRAVYRQGDESDSTFIVLSGRLRSVITHNNGKKQLVTEYGKGDLVGIVEMVTRTPRGTTVMAIRDSELAKLPEGLFNVIKLRYPIVVTRLINILGHRILGSWQNPGSNLVDSRTVDARPSQHNFTTVAIVPVSEDVPLSAFTFELYHSLCAIGSTIRLTSEIVRKMLGATIMEASNEYRLTSWLAQQEDQNNIALYQCDMINSAWSQRCIRQADCVLIVGLGDRSPNVGKMEKEVERMAMRTQKELVLLHREGCEQPMNTVTWLNMRSWISSHHHILCNKRMFSRKSQYRINELYSKVLMSDPNIHSDFSRLARWLTGTSVGLVLGGGGARGASHVGMVKAIQEAGIPIDMVGGVSIGAFMGALWCVERNVTTMTQKAREWSKKMGHWWRHLMDLTYPATSMFRGSYFNQTIHSTFKDTYIEDLWLPYFTVTTDITSSVMRIHTHGSLWRYIRGSMSLSGYMPPLCDPTDGHLLLDGGYVNNLPGLLWRYVRASMTFAGIFPPICDPADGHLLIDGCYINNVPADVMKRRGAKYILAIDVGSQDDTDLTQYGDELNGWWLLFKRLPFTSPVKVPNLPDIQSRLAYVSCVRQLEEVKNSDYCEYIRPPIDKYNTLQFYSFDEIKDVGYNHGRTFFAGMMKGGVYPPYLKPPDILPSVRECRSKANAVQSTSYTFTDLAQMVCKIQRKPYMGGHQDGHDPMMKSSDGESTIHSIDNFKMFSPKNKAMFENGMKVCELTVQNSDSSDDDYEGDEEDTQEVGYASEPSGNILDSNHSPLMRRRTGGSLSLSENELESESEFYSGKPRRH